MTTRYELRPVGVFDRELGRDITPADDEWPTYHAWLEAGNAPELPPAPPRPPLEYVLAEVLAKIEEKAAEQRAKVTYPASPQEMASWTEKMRQARAFDASSLDADAPMLAAEASARHTTTVDIAQRVLANAAAYTRAEGLIAGTSGRHRDAVRALADVDAVLAYDYLAGWPLDPPPPVFSPPPSIRPVTP
jgi:hypothetical protein